MSRPDFIYFAIFKHMYVHVKVHPKSKKDHILELKEKHFEIWVKEPAEKNLANKKIIEILKNHFILANRIRIISGHHSPTKLFSVDFDD
jgi:uncharacterized protein (TIGR00251 family)